MSLPKQKSQVQSKTGSDFKSLFRKKFLLPLEQAEYEELRDLIYSSNDVDQKSRLYTALNSYEEFLTAFPSDTIIYAYKNNRTKQVAYFTRYHGMDQKEHECFPTGMKKHPTIVKDYKRKCRLERETIKLPIDDPEKLNPYFEETFKVNERVFKQVQRDKFDLFRYPKGTKINLYRDKETKRVVGYHVIVDTKDPETKRRYMKFGPTVILKAYRNHGIIRKDSSAPLLRYMMNPLNWFRKAPLISVVCNPISFRIVATFKEYYPKAHTETPASFKKEMARATKACYPEEHDAIDDIDVPIETQWTNGDEIQYDLTNPLIRNYIGNLNTQFRTHSICVGIPFNFKNKMAVIKDAFKKRVRKPRSEPLSAEEYERALEQLILERNPKCNDYKKLTGMLGGQKELQHSLSAVFSHRQNSGSIYVDPFGKNTTPSPTNQPGSGSSSSDDENERAFLLGEDERELPGLTN